MIIKASASIRQNYNEISELCKKTKEPVFLTKNGEGDLVVMDMETYHRKQKMLELREKLLNAEEERLNGMKGYSMAEVSQMLDETIEQAEKDEVI